MIWLQNLHFWLNIQSWRELISSFRVKLPGGQSHVPLADQEDDEPDVSLITGALRSPNLLISEPAEARCGSSVVLRNQTMTVANAHSAGTSIYSIFGPSLQQKKAWRSLYIVCAPLRLIALSSQHLSWQNEAGAV